MTIKCNKFGKDELPKTIDQQEAAADKDIGKKGPKRQTNVILKTNCPCVVVVKEVGDIWKIIRLDLEHPHELQPSQRNQQFSGHKYMTGMEKTLSEH